MKPHLIVTFETQYGFVSLYDNEFYLGDSFKRGFYWDEPTLLELRKYINPSKNIIEIGGHCGTSTLVYASFLQKGSHIHVFEPQKQLFKLLYNNVRQNHLEDKIIPHNKGVFCFEGVSEMNAVDIDGTGGLVSKRYDDENELPCNFAGISLGNNGEWVELTMLDSLDIQNVGYIHCDAQGAENFIFSRGKNLIARDRPLILYENKEFYGTYLYDVVCGKFPQYQAESRFDIKEFCMKELKYSSFIDQFNGGIDTLLIP